MKDIRPVKIRGHLAFIPLTQGYEAVIDVDDLPLIDGVNWCAKVEGNSVYAVRTSYDEGVSPKGIKMHRVIAGAVDGNIVDHKNHNCLDNRRSNLRVCSHSRNMKNRKISVANKLGAKGVHWNKRANKYQSQIQVDGKRIHLGYFETLEDASSKYVEASKKYHGEYGCRG